MVRQKVILLLKNSHGKVKTQSLLSHGKQKSKNSSLNFRNTNKHKQNKLKTKTNK